MSEILGPGGNPFPRLAVPVDPVAEQTPTTPNDLVAPPDQQGLRIGISDDGTQAQIMLGKEIAQMPVLQLVDLGVTMARLGLDAVHARMNEMRNPKPPLSPLTGLTPIREKHKE